MSLQSMILILAIVPCGAIMSTDQAASATFSTRPQVILLGDSMTEGGGFHAGWGARLAGYFGRRADVFNRGFTGATSWEMRVLVEHHLANGPPHGSEHLRLIILGIGTNDAYAPSHPAHVSLQQYEKNLDVILTKFNLVLPAVGIVLVTPPAVDYKALSRFYPAARTRMLEHGPYAEVLLKVANRHGVFAVDLYGSMKKHPDWKLMSFDGMHFNAFGHEFAFHRIVEVLKNGPKHFTPEGMPWISMPSLNQTLTSLYNRLAASHINKAIASNPNLVNVLDPSTKSPPRPDEEPW